MNQEYYRTLKSFEYEEAKTITYAMEDYLEMIYRICADKNNARIKDLSLRMKVKPSSVTKMVNNLKEANLVEFKKYGSITMTELGIKLGEYLMYRHKIVNQFLCHINNSEKEVELTEKIEHYLDYRTVSNMELWLNINNCNK